MEKRRNGANAYSGTHMHTLECKPYEEERLKIIYP
jgi:hypothetical protein